MDLISEYNEFENVFRTLPINVLFKIFENLELRSLLVLCSVCKFFYNIINEEYLEIKSTSLLVTNQLSLKVRNKSLKQFSVVDKYKLHFHWINKYYNENIMLKSRERYRPWLYVNRNYVYLSRGSVILSFKRCETGIRKRPFSVFKGHSEDVVQFAVKNSHMISGGNDGRICCWNPYSSKLLFSVKNKIGWSENLYIDFSDRTLVSGFSLSSTLKFWTIKRNKFQFESKIKVKDRVRCVSLSEDARFCAVGLSGYTECPLKILDLNSELSSINLTQDFKYGAGIYNIIWEAPNCLLTGGYDTYVRQWDLRIGKCVRFWTDPFDNAIYSLGTDYNYTIMSGSGVHSRVILWDKRLTTHVHLYCFSETAAFSPVYSFDFDPRFMFAALESSLHILDFSTKSSVPHIL